MLLHRRTRQNRNIYSLNKSIFRLLVIFDYYRLLTLERHYLIMVDLCRSETRAKKFSCSKVLFMYVSPFEVKLGSKTESLVDHKN